MKITGFIKSPFVEREIERDFAEDGYLPLHPRDCVVIVESAIKTVMPAKAGIQN